MATSCDFNFGMILEGDPSALADAYQRFAQVPVDLDWSRQSPAERLVAPRTIAKPVSVSAPGTFSKNAIRTLRLEPTERPGWWLERTDIPDSRPIKVSIRNVWTTGEIVSNIVLRSGSIHNYVRLVEHIIALKQGMDVDNLVIKLDSGDPPLFNEGSKELVEAINSAGRRELPDQEQVRYFTVKQRVSLLTPHNGFLVIDPVEEGRFALDIDCVRDFPNAIGQQRIKFVHNERSFHYGATARTNSTARQKLMVTTLGKLFPESRNLGYNRKNVLIAGKRRYVNEPTHLENGKSLEAAWHRAILDLLAALALIDEGRFVGRIIDYKGGHYPDVEMVKLLYANQLLVEV
ncbi:UDP-3-O-acyl-N-acetylglucosamine deacetylase [Pelagicoccus sp. SDUM812003]|uniref:UDP-3-O-acyl-N-acetylglucosamine deacetylase n=1 Tax=Pelagicoccus sp. SDUM812003 TaxID=3041267 RepID=UPI0028106E49|nr:UDP-3-O-acyl-N-acetylglucosamine deacetylase [Pelagicoccus sp. SDUM812003]MDQ8204520.1 UDP-3-O-acyl-N-acetylglucosamine deacetylase [Pelagicoccus sp. SDUM812003]